MASAGEEENDAVLSDVEADDAVHSDIRSPSPEDVTAEKFQELFAELDRERRAREVAENSKSELQVSFNRLKVLAHEAIKKRDETTRQRDEALHEKEEALKSNEKLSADLAEISKLKDEILKQRDELAKQYEETVKAKDSSRSEIETAAQMLVSGTEKISGKVSSYKNFVGTGLPRSQKYSGLPAVAYGVIKRINEIVEELLRQIDSTAKSRNEARELMEQRNYEIAIEVSQLEATISGLREEVGKKSSVIENLEKCIAEKDGKISEIEKEMLEKQNLAENEISELRQLVSEYDDKLRCLESKMELQKELVLDQLNYVSKIHDNIYDVIKIVDANKLDHSELSESLFLPQETDMEENIRASLAGLESLNELSRIVLEKTRNLVDEKNREVKSLNETVSQLVKEKGHVGCLLRSALSKRMSVDLSSKTNELFKVAEDGLREAGIDFKFSNHLVDGKVPTSNDKTGEDNEIYALAGALESIIKQSQIEIIELQHSVDELRAESSLLKEHVEAQVKELNQWKQRVEELEEKERVANENLGAVRQDLEEAKQAIIESERKLKFKEETAAAAMTARDAAEKSLRLADLRASRLRDRVEELTHQLEELDIRDTSRTGLSRPRYVCWPWQWLGLDFVGSQRSDMQLESANEMELSEPLL
ncbi:unnamed protein product [Ilex paraguariensis]|uniref:Uncharacterized protein n=1 Tax=Ilex paraguariensis TaxID=185542 RepID=A0ABC8U2X8_9AQUA